ncbi:MAG: preprotein translocase subunit YajC [Nitrosomonadales bacterium]|nr:preprotein translocase subunit YajC [Nitrosomonadales bacterium]
MSRLLIFVVIAAVVYWLLKSYRKKLSRENEREENVPGQAEDMVRCAHCGVHLPKRESIASDGKFYCGEAHRRAHTGKVE